jgi:flagellar biosynthesis/type III secretory pathway chaperone
MMSEFAYIRDQDYNPFDYLQSWLNTNQRDGEPSQPRQPQQAQSNYSWQPQGFSNHDREPSLRDIVAQLAQVSNQLNSIVQPQIQPSSYWQSPMCSNQDHVPSLKEIIAQLAQSNQAVNQSQIESAERLRKSNEAVDQRWKESGAMLEKLIEAMNQREHEKFPSNTINPEYEKVKAVTIQSGKEMDNRAESTRLPDLITSARMKASERSYAPDPETDVIASARTSVHERSYESCNLGFDNMKSVGVWRQIDEHLYELYVEEFEAKELKHARNDTNKRSRKEDQATEVILEHVKFLFEEKGPAEVDVCEEDPYLSALFAEEEEDNDEELANTKPLVED